MRQRGLACSPRFGEAGRSHAAIALSDGAQAGIIEIVVLIILAVLVALVGGTYYLSTKGSLNLNQSSSRLTTRNDQELERDSIYFLRNNTVWSIDPVSKREERITPAIPYPTGQVPFYEISPDKKFAYIVEQSSHSLYLKRYHLNKEQVDDFGVVGYRDPMFDEEGRAVGWITHLSPSGKRILIESWPGHLGERVETVWDINGTARKILDVSELKLDPKRGLIFKGWLSDEEFIIQLYDPPRSMVYKVNINDKSAQKLFELDDNDFYFNKETREIIATVLEGEMYHLKIFDLNGTEKADLYQARKLHPLAAYPLIRGSFIPNSELILVGIAYGDGSQEHLVLKRSTNEIVHNLPLVPGHLVEEFSPDFSKGLVVESGRTACNIRIFDIYSGASDVLIKDGCQEVTEMKWIK